MNLHLTESHFFLLGGVCCVSLEEALTLCSIDNRGGCEEGLGCEASLWGELGQHLEQNKTEREDI